MILGFPSISKFHRISDGKSTVGKETKMNLKQVYVKSISLSCYFYSIYKYKNIFKKTTTKTPHKCTGFTQQDALSVLQEKHAPTSCYCDRVTTQKIFFF